MVVDAQDAAYGPGLAIIRGNGSISSAQRPTTTRVTPRGSDGQLILDDSASFFGNIYQMAVGDSIDLRDFAYNSANPSAMKLANSSTTRPGDSGFSALDGDLQITNGTSLSSNLHLEGDYQSATWTFKADALGGTIITLRRQSRPERRQRERIVKPEAQGEH